MSIEKFIEKVSVQTAVYWGSPTNDGYGGKTFADPVEIDCRWEDRTDVLRTSAGNEVVSKAKVLVTQDLDEEGFLYLGELDDLDSAPIPSEVDGAHKIVRFDKIPMIKKTDEFVRIVYLQWQGR